MAWKNYSQKKFGKINLEKRYRIVKTFIDFYKKQEDFNILDDSFLKYNLTELIESGNVYMSKEAYSKFTDEKYIIGKIPIYQFKDGPVQLRYSQYIHNKNKPEGLIWEHVVPVDKLIKLLLDEDDLSKEKFMDISSKANVCIVTSDENEKLGEKYQSTMPENWNLENGDPWARYCVNEIKVYGKK